MPNPPASNAPGATRPASPPMSPGDEAPTGTPGTGPTVCPRCGGSGKLEGKSCPECQGSGQLNVGIGGA